MSADTAALVFESSKCWPVAIGFIGLGTGYLVGGSQRLMGLISVIMHEEGSNADTTQSSGN
jgi:hypothetical protein